MEVLLLAEGVRGEGLSIKPTGLIWFPSEGVKEAPTFAFEPVVVRSTHTERPSPKSTDAPHTHNTTPLHFFLIVSSETDVLQITRSRWERLSFAKFGKILER